MKKFSIYLLLILGVVSMGVSCSDDNNDSDKKVVLPDSKASEPVASNGFYIANEDWFGHDEGTVNYFTNSGSINYRAYRAANPGETLGTTTQFATIYGDYIYFVSKMGNRLVVTDKELKKKAVITDLSSDGRAFIGVSENKAYISTYRGINIFDIETLSVTGTISGISGECGGMVLAGNRVFIINKSVGVQVVNASTDELEETIVAGSVGNITQSKDGHVWVSNESAKTLTKVNPYTLETATIDISSANIGNTWFAWNAGSLCASTQENALYWKTGKNINKLDVTTQQITTIYTLGSDDEGKALAYYGAGLRVDPLTDKVIATVYRSGWGDSYSYNWVHILDNTGNVEKVITVKGGTGAEGTENDNYYWFPAVPFFEDNNKPEILLNQIIVAPDATARINLNEKIVDADNASATIVKSFSWEEDDLLEAVSLEENTLVVKAKSQTGKTKITIKALSNGQIAEKEIRVDVRE
ncbi:DUF5074 domain-containing protein [Dysgonomonas sp. 25]|uniref:DUF5074 domain-containing protein n=1 Tax=Dysgonomonas sp. 25 TaxID=2302933 RepID=UPI0013D06938|nr:DUF5074 domain-containing protein [Dysgonomonas sp. 25]NDV68670.1 DUF5074 domain-containing protein [Dysgonomonas sp. 25]